MAESKERANITHFTDTLKILVEGGGYANAWIETQPMGGEMYAKRNLEVALGNQWVFMLGQRKDGRLPGMVIAKEKARKGGQDVKPPEGMAWISEAGILADYEMFQGYCFPDPAWKMYHWIGKDPEYLQNLYRCLEAHDGYLWRHRDSNGDGILETWCTWDTGEDHSKRYMTRFAPTRWPFDEAPIGDRLPDPQVEANYRTYWIEHQRENVPPPTRDQVMVPFASMDLMAYSYDGRATLAKISRELGDGREAFWRDATEEVRARVIRHLWDEERHACFDRDRHGKPLPELIHNNLRCMHHGLFTQAMADAFIREHLLNPDEFWTPIPLVSIAIHDPLYRNEEGNSWSGQPEALTYQRAIRALENYGHHAELMLLGRKLMDAVIQNDCRFTQQLDPYTGRARGPQKDGYGPMMLAILEYLSRMHGIHLDVENQRIGWSALGDTDFEYRQAWGNRTWVLTADQDSFSGSLGGKKCFTCNRGCRVVTDLDGNLMEIVGIEAMPVSIRLETAGKNFEFSMKPNQVWTLGTGNSVLTRTVPFDYPFEKRS